MKGCVVLGRRLDNIRVSVNTKLILATLLIIFCLGVVNVWNIVNSNRNSKAYYDIMNQIQVAHNIIVATGNIEVISRDYIMQRQETELEEINRTIDIIEADVFF